MKKLQKFLATSLALSMFLPTLTSAFTVTYNTEPPQSDDFVGYYDVDTGETGFVSTTTSTSVPIPVYDDLLMEIPESDLDLMQKLTYNDLIVIVANIYYNATNTTRPSVETTEEMLVDLVKHGILEDKPLDSTLTREEAAYYLWSASGLDGGGYGVTDFSDNDEINPNYTEAIYQLKLFNVICGNDDNTFAPKREITSWEFSIMANNTIKQIAPLVSYEANPDNYEYGYAIPESSSAEMEDAWSMDEFHSMIRYAATELEKSEDFTGWDGVEIITWDTKNGGLTSSKENSPLLQFILNEEILMWFGAKHNVPAFSEWAKSFEVSFHIVEKPDDYVEVTWNSDTNFLIFTPVEELAELIYCPLDIQGTMVEDGTIWDKLMMTLPTNLEVYGNDLWGNTDTTAFNELVKVCTIAMALLEDLENSVGTNITWHTTATDGIYVSTDEPEGNAPVLQEINHMLGENGKNLGVAVSDWGKASDMTLTIAMDENKIPYVYTDNQSAAFRLNVSTSATDRYTVPETDPTPDDNGETKYEYFAMTQDFTMLGIVLGECFPLLLAEDGNLSVGDTLTWKLDRENASQFVVHQQNGTTMQDIVDEALSIPNRHNLPSASEILETVDATFEVALSEQGDLFFFTDDPFLSTSLTLPINDKEEYKKIDVEKDWMIIADEEEGWWREEFTAPSGIHADYNAANELVKISMIATAMSEEIPEGVTITWHTDLPEGSEINVTVEGGNEELRSYMENEIFATLGSYGMPAPLSEEAREINFSFTIKEDENGLPRLFAHDAFWGDNLGLSLLEE